MLRIPRDDYHKLICLLEKYQVKSMFGTIFAVSLHPASHLAPRSGINQQSGQIGGQTVMHQTCSELVVILVCVVLASHL